MLGKLAAASDSCLTLLQRNLSFFLVFPSTQNSHLNQTLDGCLSVSSSALSDFYSLERRTLLEKQAQRKFYRMISISQTFLHLIKFSVEIDFFNKQKTENMSFEELYVRRWV